MLTGAQVFDLLSLWPIGNVVAMEPFHTEDYHFSGNVVFVQTLNEKYVLKRTKTEDWPEWRYPMLTILHSNGVPVAVPMLTRTGEVCLHQGDAVFTLSPYLPGIAVSDHFAGRAEERARQYGIALAQLHLGLRECETIARPTEMDLVRDVNWARRMIAETSCDDQTESVAVLMEVMASLESIRGSLPIQLIHRDAHAANLLYLDNKVTGWLDFDLAVRGPRLFDICYCATSLLMNGIDDPGKRLRWVELLRSIVNGYIAVSELCTAERAALFHLLLSIEAIFAGYYASLNDAKQTGRNIQAMLWIHKNRDLLCHIG